MVLGAKRGGIGEKDERPLVARDVLGCLSLPTDVLAEAVPLPPLSPGDVLAFPNAGAYGLWASPMHFHGHEAPAEVVFDETQLEVIRVRPSVQSILEGQSLLSRAGFSIRAGAAIANREIG
jgi:hypothetical protein